MRLLFIMTIISWAYARNIINCPKNCICDKTMNWKRVQCTNHNLLNIGDDIPVSVDILDISYNQISELFEDEFINLGMTSIKFLNISHNKIGHMHLNAFRDLNKLRIIDLSFNIIEYIMHEWFYRLPNLKELYMSNNNFFKLRSDSALLQSKSLEVLDISYCKLTKLSTDTFKELPALKTLKLDGNFLIEISPVVIKTPKTLQKLTVSGNPFICGKVMNDLRRYAKNARIKYIDPCPKLKPSNIERSQKMITLEEPVQSNNLWIYEEDTDADAKMSPCNYTELPMERRGLILDIIDLSPVGALLITLLTGFMMGLIIGCGIHIGCSNPKMTHTPLHSRRGSIIRSIYIENTLPLVGDCEHIFESTPMMNRRVEMYSSR